MRRKRLRVNCLGAGDSAVAALDVLRVNDELSADVTTQNVRTRSLHAYTGSRRWTRATRIVQYSTRSTQPCIPPGSLNRVPASTAVRAGMSPLPGGR